jgi:hypothetical protein
LTFNIATKEIVEQLKRIADLLEEHLPRSGTALRSRYFDTSKNTDYTAMITYPDDEEEEIEERPK